MTREEAIRELWEAATAYWGDEDEDGTPIPLADELRDSSIAIQGQGIKGKRLYWIGVELGLIEEGEHA